MIRVLVVDDSAVLRQQLSYILQNDPAITIVDQARNSEEALELTKKLRPDVVTMDVRMPRMDGLKAVRWIMAEYPVPIVVVTANDVDRELDYVISPTVPQDVVVDACRLRQVLARLIDNAIKFTEQGQVQVRLEDNGLTDGKVELHFSVQDTGAGISTDKLEAIFEPFQQADISTTRRHGGIGLGLTLSRELVILMHGRIWAESQVGVGSTFHFTVEAKCAEKIPPTAAVPTTAPGAGAEAFLGSTGDDEVDLPHLRVLLAEDSATNQLLAMTNLEKAGHSVVVAKNGRLAVEAYERESFDLILMDVTMPEMDGLEATRCIREKEQLTGAAHIPIIAMTAFATNEYQEKCREAGMDGYMTKPVAADELHRAIAPFLAGRREAALDEVDEVLPVDLAIAYDLVGEDMDLLTAIVEVSLLECPRLMEELREAISQVDAGTVEHAAHTLKGTVANIGAGPTRDLCQSLETMGAEGDLAGALNVLPRLEVEMQRLVDFFADSNWARSVPVKEGGMGKVRILVVDDSRPQVILIQTVLQRDGYEVYTAENGEQGLEEARRVKPHLVILDIMMPGMDGYEVCYRLKSDPATAKAAVLMLTAKGDTEGQSNRGSQIATDVRDRVRAFDVGALDFITKPVKATELSKRVKSLLWSGGIGF